MGANSPEAIGCAQEFMRCQQELGRVSIGDSMICQVADGMCGLRVGINEHGRVSSPEQGTCYEADLAAVLDDTDTKRLLDDIFGRKSPGL